MYLGDDLKIAISQEAWAGGTSVWIARKGPQGLAVAEPVELVFRAAEEGATVEPTLQMNSEFAHQLFAALAEALDEQGIKTTKDANLAGELTATKYHLEDMRSVAGVNDA